jgi:ParB family chromosome partitioning protein
VRADFNYRRRYDPKKLAELADSIKRQDLIAPVVVRKLEADPTFDYELIVGGRRFKAYPMAFGEESSIPAFVRVLTDAEATAMMMAENGDREDPSIIEDAEGAARMLGLCNGDRDAAASRLGWDRKKFDKRLALMNATQSVRDAYIEGHLDVGHVEILAAFRKDVQDNIIGKLRQTNNWPTMAEQALCNLDAAIFDRTECQGCQHNSGYQQQMFEVSFEGSKCANKSCYEAKTEGELEKRRAALTSDYQVVRIVRPGENHTLIQLRAEDDKGIQGVGPEQAQACRTCGDFGACVSAVPDKLGKTFKDICFNKTCHDDKVKAFKEQQKALAPEQQETSSDAHASAPNAKANNRTSAPAAKQSSRQASAPTASPATLRNAIKEYREQVWRKVFRRAALKLTMMPSRALFAGVLLYRSSYIDGSAAADAINKALGTDLSRVASNATERLLKELLGFDQQKLATVFNHLAASITQDMPIDDLVGLLNALGVRIEDYWKVNDTFFDILTKTEIDAVCKEIGLDKAAGKTYTSLVNGSKKDFVAAMLKVDGFAYDGAVPKMMRWDS